MIFYPSKIRVGFNERADTYTGRLAYVIYYDEKNKLRKETSFENWRNKKIDVVEYKNTPTSGFVLNKKAGGYKSYWNMRQTYARVYDPRGFEFEITIENLLYILENANCMKGKGLEGEFVYCWDSGNHILMPVSTPDFIKIKNDSKRLKTNGYVLVKNLKIGATYLTTRGEEWVYLGRFETFENCSWHERTLGASKGKRHCFWHNENKAVRHSIKGYEAISSTSGKIVDIITEQPPDDFAFLIDGMQDELMFNPIEKKEYLELSYSEFSAIIAKYSYCDIGYSVNAIPLFYDNNGRGGIREIPYSIICSVKYGQNVSEADIETNKAIFYSNKFYLPIRRQADGRIYIQDRKILDKLNIRQ